MVVFIITAGTLCVIKLVVETSVDCKYCNPCGHFPLGRGGLALGVRTEDLGDNGQRLGGNGQQLGGDTPLQGNLDLFLGKVISRRVL